MADDRVSDAVASVGFNVLSAVKKALSGHDAPTEETPAAEETAATEETAAAEAIPVTDDVVVVEETAATEEAPAAAEETPAAEAIPVTDDVVVVEETAATEEAPAAAEETPAAEETAAEEAPDIDALADAVIRGDYGNGEEREAALGDLYEQVQARVNEKLA